MAIPARASLADIIAPLIWNPGVTQLSPAHAERTTDPPKP